MKKSLVNLVVIFVLSLSAKSFAKEEAADGDVEAIRKCLSNWDHPPFKKSEPNFKTFGGNVNVFGIGGEVADTEKTDKPKLILVKPNVNVLGKATLKLMNPQGWYCLKPTISVLAKTQIESHCKAHVTSTTKGSNIMGAQDKEQGVVVLGSLRIKQIGCEE